MHMYSISSLSSPRWRRGQALNYLVMSPNTNLLTLYNVVIFCFGELMVAESGSHVPVALSYVSQMICINTVPVSVVYPYQNVIQQVSTFCTRMFKLDGDGRHDKKQLRSTQLFQ